MLRWAHRESGATVTELRPALFTSGPYCNIYHILATGER